MVKTWREIKQDFLDQITPQVGEREAISQFQYILDYFDIDPQLSRLDLKQISDWQLSEVQNMILRVRNHEPIQHIVGFAWFDDHQFKVTSEVLIPRQETEELVYWIVNDHKNNSPKRILDIGTGSGCIAIALAKHFPKSEVVAWDISETALEVAKENKEKLSVSNVHFEEVDVLAIETLDQGYDIIVSNPPYIPQDYVKEMEKKVKDYEPQQALFVPNNDPLLFYEKIASLITPHKSHLYFEINEFYKEETVKMLREHDFQSITPRKDLNDNWRMIKVESKR